MVLDYSGIVGRWGIVLDFEIDQTGEAKRVDHLLYFPSKRTPLFTRTCRGSLFSLDHRFHGRIVVGQEWDVVAAGLPSSVAHQLGWQFD